MTKRKAISDSIKYINYYLSCVYCYRDDMIVIYNIKEKIVSNIKLSGCDNIKKVIRDDNMLYVLYKDNSIILYKIKKNKAVRYKSYDRIMKKIQIYDMIHTGFFFVMLGVQYIYIISKSKHKLVESYPYRNIENNIIQDYNARIFSLNDHLYVCRLSDSFGCRVGYKIIELKFKQSSLRFVKSYDLDISSYYLEVLHKPFPMMLINDKFCVVKNDRLDEFKLCFHQTNGTFIKYINKKINIKLRNYQIIWICGYIFIIDDNKQLYKYDRDRFNLFL